MSNWLLWIAAGLLAAMCFCSAAHLSLRLASRTKLADKLERRGRARLLERLTEFRDELALVMASLRTTLVLALALVVVRILQLTRPEAGAWSIYGAAFLSSMVLVVLFGVAIPSAIAQYGGASLLAGVLPLLFVLRRLFYPFVLITRLVDAPVRRLAGAPEPDSQSAVDALGQDILDAVSEGELHGAVDEEEKEMIESVMEMRDSQVSEIMTPRTEIVALEKSATLAEVKQLIQAEGPSRIPVYEDTIDTILGVLYAKDLLFLEEGTRFDCTKVMRPALFIPESKAVRELLKDFRTQKVHIALVLDEYGGTAGLVTIEDIIEELVGEIADEHEADEPTPIKRIDDDTIEVDARMRINEVNEALRIGLPEDEDYETVGGFVFSTLGRIPTVGEKCEHENVEISVLAAEPRRINRLLVHIRRPSEAAAASD